MLKELRIRHRLVFDGRDGRLALECSSADEVGLWDKTVWETSIASGDELPVAAVAAAI